MEFVALPGMAEKLQTIIPEAMSEAFGHRGSFSGCIAQVSDAEMGLMNVITLWTGKDRAKHCANSKERMNQVLLPYVDRWARTRRMTTLLCVL
jgi:primase-polymerase (primpol)-like protein